jgi:hypothetical protein
MILRTSMRRAWCARVRIIAAALVAASAAAQTPGEGLHAEPPAKIMIDPPEARALAAGEAVIPYRTENLQVAPVFGRAALSVSPRVGHLHVRVDDTPWVWAHTSGNPVIIFGLAPGRHKVRLQLMNANHQRLDEGAVEFAVPETRVPPSAAAQTATQAGWAADESASKQAAPKIIADAPLPEPLSRGVVLIRYRTENVDLLPVYGPAAFAVSPRIAHVHVTVDGGSWHWAEASGGPVIVQGLAPGRHQILIELVNANRQAMDRTTVELNMGGASSEAAAEFRPAKGDAK